ncbi:MAG: rhodanese-like domain-containing protein [Campylobacterales bacterium]
MRVVVGIIFILSILNADTFDAYLSRFDYKERQAMKIKSGEAMELFVAGEAIFVDIRFPEEHTLWNFPFMKSIPLNELPKRINELDKNKTIITVCPHYDRAEIARLYLTLKGYKSRYLTDGLLGLAGYLRGDNAKEIVEEMR